MKRDSSKTRRHYSLDDYFMVELESLTKHEFYDGDIFAIAGASLSHNHITSNLHALLRAALRGTGCYAFTSDLRIATPGGLYTYPDVSVICGTVELVPGRPDTATNPVLLIEVLSEATRDYDQIPILKEYLVVEAERSPRRTLAAQLSGAVDGEEAHTADGCSPSPDPPRLVAARGDLPRSTRLAAR
jgi:Uma2 family endonuclease